MKTTSTNGFQLLPISLDGEVAGPAQPLPDELTPMIEETKALYAVVGFEPPWISYVSIQNGLVVGGGAFVGPPKERAVEIAYFTHPELQGRGHAHQTAQALLQIARTHNPIMSLWAKTLPHPGPSTRILERLGFRRTGLVIDHEIGEAWHWTLTP